MIRGLKQPVISQFTGKHTFNNLAAGKPGSLLSARNLMVLDEQELRRAPGYSLVANVGNAPITQIYDFQRDVDQKQFVFVQCGGQISVMQANGSGLQVLATSESAPHQFVSNAFACYSSNGVTAYRYVDVGGVLTRYKWGITPPATAPSIATGTGTLNLTYGRSYVYCYVSQYTDSLGVQRISVSAPSQTSAFSGPVTNGVVTLSNIEASTDPQVNFIWIFEVTDSPFDTNATYFFAAQIANGTTSFGDTLADSALDQTRLAPFENFPAPDAPILVSFQNRVFAANGSLMQFSGFTNILLGIPEEAWPPSDFFNVPSGKRTITAMIDQGEGTELAVSTEDYWYRYTGYNAATFTEQDKIAEPGAAGPLALCHTPFGVAFLSKSKRLWLWKAGGLPTDISSGVARLLAGTYTMDSIDSAHIQNAVVRWFEFGSVSLLCVFCRTSDAPDANLNLVQLWSIGVKSSASVGTYFGSSSLYEQISGIWQTDKIPSVSFTTAANVEQNGEFFLFCGDANGNIYKFPDGFLDNGGEYLSSGVLAWICPGEGENRFYFVDLFTDRQDALASFGVQAITADAPDPTLPLQPVETQQLPNPRDPSPLAIRGNLQADGTAIGRYLSIGITFPSDGNDAVLRKVALSYVPLYESAP